MGKTEKLSRKFITHCENRTLEDKGSSFNTNKITKEEKNNSY